MADADACYGRVRQAVLAYILDHQGLRIEAISQGVGIPEAEVVPALLLLEEQGLVKTSGNIEDASSTGRYFAVMRD